MKITGAALAPYLTGTVRTEQTPSGLLPHRFSAAQQEAFDDMLPYYPGEFFIGYFARNCLAAAGITVDLITDSSRLTLKMSGTPVNDATLGVCDYVLDGRIRRSFPPRDVSFRLPPGEHRVTVWLPYFNQVTLAAIEADGEVRPVPRRPLLLTVGDSITHGVGAARPACTYAARLSRLLDMALLNQANSGYVYDARIAARQAEPSLILFACGANDIRNKPLPALERETDEALAAWCAAYPHVPATAFTPLWKPTLESDAALAEKDQKARPILKSLYEKHGIRVIDGLSLIPHSPAYFDHTMHPNPRGHRILAGRLAAALAANRKEQL